MCQELAKFKLLLFTLMLLLTAHTSLAQSSAFTYQGRLTDSGAPSNGTYELEFKLYDALTGGTQQPQPAPVTVQFTGAQAVTVVNGVFTVQLDFGASAFPGAARYLEVGVRRAGDPSFTTLSPRQPVTATPYAIRSVSAATAVDFSGSLSGDVTGTQSATVVSSVGGQSAANVASGVSAANSATDASTSGAIVKRDASGNFSAGTITATLNGNASTATTATTATTASAVSAAAGDSVVTAINASSSTINAARLPSTLATQNGANTFSGTNTFSTSPSFNAGLSSGGQRITNVGAPTDSGDAATKAYVDASVSSTSGAAGGHLTGTYPNPSIATTAAAGTNIVAAVNASSSSINTANVNGDVELAPDAQQTTSSTNDLINLKLNGVGTLGTSGTNDLLSLSASGQYSTGALDFEWFRMDNAGGFLAMGTYDGENEVVGVGTIPAEGNGSRMMWYGAKAAFRAGYVNNGAWDDANVGQGSFAVGMNNRASGRLSTAFGNSNVVSGIQSMAIGSNNTVSGTNSFAHGSLNTVSGNNSTALGSQNTIGSSANSGAFTFGLLSQANASQAYAIGERATVSSTRAMVISLGPSFGVATNDAGTATFTVRAANGIYFGTNTGTPSITSGHFIETSTGAYLTSTGVWTNTSDRNVKENFVPVNGEELLLRLGKVPMTTWKYRADATNIRHLGPMAQDFSAAFGLGDSNKTISTVDASGVALAASQALEARTTAQQQRINSLEQQVKEQQQQIDALKKLLCLDRPEAPVCKESR